MKVLGCFGVIIAILAVGFGIDAGIAEILHLAFPTVLGFWKWFGVVVVAGVVLGSTGVRVSRR
ncbi:hypothetical protein [Kitasatospora mediocidica]|uniref:hypothetical protein n=1 Tax=Kitasatospora mediocidica TaxID=58352 RepID=UPI00055D1334|nr:hypothetical protein [Kitasatospora mediocidica]